MVAAILTMAAQLDDRKGATARASSNDDDDAEPGENTYPAVKSVATPHLEDAYVVDSNDDSFSSTASSLDASVTTGSATLSEKVKDSSSEDDIDTEDNAQDTTASGFRTIHNPIFEGLLRKIDCGVGEKEFGWPMPNSAQQQEDGLGNDECGDEGNYGNDVDERSRLMVADQAASIPSDDTFSDDSEDGSPHARSMSTMPKISKEMSTRAVPTVAKAHQDSKDLESNDGSSFLSVETDSERSSNDDESQVNNEVHNRTRISSQMTEYTSRKSSRNSAEAGEEGSDDGSSGLEQIDHSSGSEGKRPKRKDLKSASFPAKSTSFRWSNVKTKVFYSFRALKASAGSSSDGSRTISVRNLAGEVTDDHLYDLFKDSGSILDMWVIQDAQSGLSSAYVEFESGNAARKAVRKSGNKLKGRVILCDIAYEKSKGSQSVPDSGRGVRDRSELFESKSASFSNRMAEKRSALKLFHPELQEGDAKFLSRFSEPIIISSYGDIQPAAGNPGSVSTSRLSAGRLVEGRKGVAFTDWSDSYEDSIVMPGKTRAEFEHSVYFNAQNLEAQQLLTVGPKISWAWGRTKRKLPRYFWPWKWPHWQRPYSAKQSSTGARSKTRASGLKVIDTKQKKSKERKTDRASGLKVIDKKQKTSKESVKCEFVKLCC